MLPIATLFAAGIMPARSIEGQASPDAQRHFPQLQNDRQGILTFNDNRSSQ